MSSSSPSPQIKICGINAPQALDAAIAARANYAGFVFYPRSPRHVELAAAAALGARAEGRIVRVGLFVDADDATIAAAVEAARLDVLQLHGGEDAGRVAALSARFGLPVWKAVPIAAVGDLARVEAFAGLAARVLLDARTPKGTLPGGMGLAFDWNLLSGWKAPCPWGLAGGLSPSNITEAIARTHPQLVDCSSGVESAPGVKDPALIAAFCAAVRAG